MKSLAAAFVASVLVSISAVVCFAQQGAKVSLSLDDNKSMLFSINCNIESARDVCGGGFLVCYDSSMLELCNVNSDFFDTEYRVKNGEAKVVFANADATKSDSTELSLAFKSKVDGRSQIEVKSAFCVDSNLCEYSTQQSSIDVDVSTGTVKKVSTKRSKTDVKTSRSNQSGSEHSSGDEDITIFEQMRENSGVVYQFIALLCVAVLLFLFNKKAQKPENKDKQN